MNAWPQIMAGAWLLVGFTLAVIAAARPSPAWVTLTPTQQRKLAVMFAALTLSEAAVLWAGGFFERMF